MLRGARCGIAQRGIVREPEATVVLGLAQDHAARRIEPAQILETGFHQRGADAAPLPVGQHGERRQTVKVTADAAIRAGVNLTQ